MSSERGAGTREGGESVRDESGKVIQVVQARELLGDRGVLRIDLDGEQYTLRLTRNGRLILTK